MLSTRFLLALSTSIVLAACQTPLRADVNSFRSSALPQVGETISVAAATPELAESLEFRDHATLLADRLRGRGLDVVSNAQRPMLIAQFEYSIDGGREVLHSRSVPIFGQTGTTTTYVLPRPIPPPYVHRHTGTYQPTDHRPVPVQSPTYGITGYSTDVYSITEYTRILRLTIRRTGEYGGMVYQGSLRSRGTCANLTALIAPMLDALLQDFPGAYSQNRTVEVDLPKENACRG